MKQLIALAVSLVLASSSLGAPTALEAANLRCEMKTDPLGIDLSSPRLSWIMLADGRSKEQTAYHVLAATSADKLKPGGADLWDSGRVETSQSIQVEYAGKPLRTNQQAFWTVQIWDNAGNQSAWAKPAKWTAGVMNDADWHAQWVGFGSETDEEFPPIENAEWIWSAPTTSALRARAGAIAIFRKSFKLPGGAELLSATLALAVDNDAIVNLNGSELGKADNWAEAKQFDLLPHIKTQGENTLEIRVTNGGEKPNPAGLLAAVLINVRAGEPVTLVSDKSWTVTSGTDRNEKPATVIGKRGMQPWGEVKVAKPQLLPIARKEIVVEKPVRRALVNVCGLGAYRLFINGKPASSTYLDPPWSMYGKTVFYNTLDVTSLLRDGTNAFGIMLGNSYYHTAGSRRIHGYFSDRPLVFILQANIEFVDGTMTQVISDPTWKWTHGPMTHNSILAGTDYDARMLPEGWATAEFDDSKWFGTARAAIDNGRLAAAISPPLQVLDEFKAISIDEPRPGHFVYDFGQNASAAPRLKVRGKAGDKLRLVYGEKRQGATPSVNNGKGLVDQTGTGFGYIEYTCRGGEDEEWFSNFFYTGYQYLELTGAVPAGQQNPEGKPVVLELTSHHVRSSAETIGEFHCSNPLYEKIDRLVDWSVRSNLSHVLTDCPHREKLGWLEVPWLMWGSMAYKYDLPNFGRKVALDIRDSQSTEGQIFTVAPKYPTFRDGFEYTPEWGAAGVFIPWYVYRWYDDERMLRESYDSMKAFVDFMHRSADGLLPKAGLGDWYDYGHGKPLGPSQFTPVELTAQMTFHECADVVSSAAKVLGKDEDAALYAKLAADIAADVNRRFYQENGEYKNHGSPQTANSMALMTGIVPPEERLSVVTALISDLERRDSMQTSGDIGFRFLVRALADFADTKTIFRMLNRKGRGSYAFIIDAGWTALPESWNADRSYSMNHCMLGHIQEWFMHDLVGIQPVDNAFKRFRIRPAMNGDITSASGSFLSPYGEIRVEWEKNADGWTIRAKVPPNTVAEVEPPGTPLEKIRESGNQLRQADGVTIMSGPAGKVLVVRSGEYEFRYR